MTTSNTYSYNKSKLKKEVYMDFKKNWINILIIVLLLILSTITAIIEVGFCLFSCFLSPIIALMVFLMITLYMRTYRGWEEKKTFKIFEMPLGLAIFYFCLFFILFQSFKEYSIIRNTGKELIEIKVFLINFLFTLFLSICNWFFSIREEIAEFSKKIEID